MHCFRSTILFALAAAVVVKGCDQHVARERPIEVRALEQGKENYNPGHRGPWTEGIVRDGRRNIKQMKENVPAAHVGPWTETVERAIDDEDPKINPIEGDVEVNPQQGRENVKPGHRGPWTETFERAIDDHNPKINPIEREVDDQWYGYPNAGFDFPRNGNTRSEDIVSTGRKIRAWFFG